MSYIDIYRKRLNRYGLDYQSRVQEQRDRNFGNYLLKSIYRVDFWYDNIFVPASLERYKQDATETQCYLLTPRETIIPNGTIIMVESRDGSEKPWMVWWKEETEASGYNTYVVLKMTHFLSWRDSFGNLHEQWAYFSGPGASLISDTIKSSNGEAIFKQNENLHTIITPYHKELVRDVYFEIAYKETVSGYIITGVDVNSTQGVSYITVDPASLRDKGIRDSGAQHSVSAKDYWFGGGN